MKAGILFSLSVIAAGSLLLAQQGSPDPWNAGDLVAPDALAALVKSGKAPAVLYVGFPVLYRAAHVPGAILAGPGSKPEGIELLKTALARYPKDAEIVVYCGCCPWNVCPNVRPAFKLIKEMGYTRAKLVTIPTNVHTDWTSKGYPVEKAPGAAEKP